MPRSVSEADRGQACWAHGILVARGGRSGRAERGCRVPGSDRWRGQRRLFAAIANLVDLTISPFYPDAWPEPRFHVLIGRDGVDDEVGVRTARTKRRAREALAQVEQILATSTLAQARAILDLDFDGHRSPGCR
jgi:hypothetical protein